LTKIVIIGGRGNGTVIASTIEDCRAAGQDIECVGFLSDDDGEEINGYPILNSTEPTDWKALPDEYQFIYALSSVGKAHERHQLLANFGIPPNRFATVIHPSAEVSGEAEIGSGVVIMPLVIVGPDVILGNHTHLYGQSFVGHDTKLDEMVFVSNNVSLGSHIHVKDGAHLGTNSSFVEHLTIGEYSIVGLSSAVLNDVKPFDKVAGNPAESIGSVRLDTK